MDLSNVLQIATITGCSIYIFLTIKEKIEQHIHKKDTI